MVMSCELDLGIQDVVERCWQELQLMRIYTKRYVSNLKYVFIRINNPDDLITFVGRGKIRISARL